MADKQWTSDNTKEFFDAVGKMYYEAVEEYGEQITKQLAYGIVCEHPERGLDGEVSAYAFGRNGKNRNVLKLAALIIRSCATKFSKDSGWSIDLAMAQTIKHVLAEVEKEDVEVSRGDKAEWPGFCKKKK